MEVIPLIRSVLPERALARTGTERDPAQAASLAQGAPTAPSLTSRLSTLARTVDLNVRGDADYHLHKLALDLHVEHSSERVTAESLLKQAHSEGEVNKARAAKGEKPVDLLRPLLHKMSNDQLGELLVNLTQSTRRNRRLRAETAFRVVTAKCDPAFVRDVLSGKPFHVDPMQSGRNRGYIDGVLTYARKDTELAVAHLKSIHPRVQALRDADPIRVDDPVSIDNYLQAAGLTAALAKLDNCWIDGQAHLQALEELPQYLDQKSLWIQTYFSYIGDAAEQHFTALENGIQDAQKRELGLSEADPAQPHARAILFYDKQGSSGMTPEFARRIQDSPWVTGIGLTPHEFERVNGVRTDNQLYEHSKLTAVRLGDKRYKGCDVILDWGTGNINDQEINLDPSVEWKNINGRSMGQLALEGLRIAVQLAEDHGQTFTNADKAYYLRTLPPGEQGDIRSFVAKHTGNREALGQLVYKALIEAATELWLFSPYNSEQGVFEDMVARAKQGAKINVVFADKDNHFMSKLANESFYRYLHQNGVNVLADSGGGMEHTKGALANVNGDWYLFLTSYNDDDISRQDGEFLTVLRIPKERVDSQSGSAEPFVKGYRAYLARVNGWGGQPADAHPVGTSQSNFFGLMKQVVGRKFAPHA